MAMSQRLRALVVASLCTAWPATPISQSQNAVRLSIDNVSTLARVIEGLPQAKSIREVLPVRPATLPGVVEGRVTVKLTIARDGTVRNARVVHSAPLFDEAALSAFRQWRFEPFIVNDAPVEAVLTKTAVFPRVPSRITLSETAPAIEVAAPRLLERVEPTSSLTGPSRASGQMIVEVAVGGSGVVTRAQVLRRGPSAARPQNTPLASIASATLANPARLAPTT